MLIRLTSAATAYKAAVYGAVILGACAPSCAHGYFQLQQAASLRAELRYIACNSTEFSQCEQDTEECRTACPADPGTFDPDKLEEVSPEAFQDWLIMQKKRLDCDIRCGRQWKRCLASCEQ